MPYFNAKLNGATINYPAYDKELYALVMTLETRNIIFGIRM